ncbi:MAG: DUF1553 domain-containing protein [Armatimonas sp.]
MRRRRIPHFVWTAPLAALTLAPLFLPRTAGAKRDVRPGNTGVLTYNQDIRPILAENCFPCHGPDSAARKAGLRLDRFTDATQMSAFVPGDPVASEAIRRVFKDESDYLHMPPASGHKSLTDDQKAMLVRWVDQGAVYEQHWSYLPPKKQTPPNAGAGWARNPIDRFIAAKLAEKGLSPAPEADRRTLARRLALDLTGLPPAALDVEEFVKDTSPNAYEKLVDRYLDSPAYGEHRGRYWLDAARYADSNGIHFDNYREMWAYRDWVINAFNKNQRFDAFVVEQLAGDLLPSPTLEQRVATGFTRCNITTNEGGAIDEEYRVLYARDRTETLGQVFLGETVGCAVCHDHKFDPISQKDFYSLSAFFNNTTQNAMDGNVKDTPPTIPVPLVADRARVAQLKTLIPEARKAAEERKATARTAFETWLSGEKQTAVTLPGDSYFYAALSEGEAVGQVSPKAYVRKDNATQVFPEAGDFEGDKPFSVAVWVKPVPNAAGAIVARMDEGADFRGWDLWMEGGRVGSHLINKWPDDAVKVVAQEPLKANAWNHVCLVYDGSKKPSSYKIYVDGQPRTLDTANDTLKSTTRTTTPFKIGQRSGGAGISDGTAVQDVRLYGRALSAQDALQLATGTRATYLLGKTALTGTEKEELFGWWLPQKDADYAKLNAKAVALLAEQAQIMARGTVAHVANEKPGMPEAYVLFRGEYDKRRDKVGPLTPASLPAMPADYPKNRLGLAKWLLRPENPLTARVTVNRFWQEVFGNGLVRSAGDFGITGELPTHPELLDWLALDFERDWDIKRFFKQIVMSATYRQASTVTAEKKARDRDNGYLSRGARYRMDAEMLRDYALATSGLLVRKIGGPSVKPYQPDGVWEAVAMIGSNTRDYQRDKGESLYRRSLYTFWKRAAPPASMEIFNAPNRETCVVKRERTNTPLQALVTLNDVQFIEAARHLATKALKESDSLNFLAERLLARPLDTFERLVLEMNISDLEEYYSKHPDEAAKLITEGESKPDSTLNPNQLAAWTMLTNQMLNLDEVLSK